MIRRRTQTTSRCSVADAVQRPHGAGLARKSPGESHETQTVKNIHGVKRLRSAVHAYASTHRRAVRGLCFVGVDRRPTPTVTVRRGVAWRGVALAGIYVRVGLFSAHGGKNRRTMSLVLLSHLPLRVAPCVDRLVLRRR